MAHDIQTMLHMTFNSFMAYSMSSLRSDMILTVLTSMRTRSVHINVNLGMALGSRPVMVSSVANGGISMDKSHRLLGNQLDTGVGHGLLAEILLLEPNHVVLVDLRLGGLSGGPSGVSVGSLLGVLLGDLDGVAVVRDDGLGHLGGDREGPLGNKSAEHRCVWVVCLSFERAFLASW